MREVAPWGTGPKHPQNRVQDRSVIPGRSPRAGALGRKERLEPLPLRVG